MTFSKELEMIRSSKHLTLSCLFTLLVSHVGIALAEDFDPATLPAVQMTAGKTVVNGHALSAQTLRQFAVRGMNIPAGQYWYDALTGAWGRMGHGVEGVLPAGLPIKGKLRPDASRGRTGVFINGRQLAASDVTALSRMGVRAPAGRYWCRADGACGRVGSGQVLINLKQATQQEFKINGRGIHGPNSVYSVDGATGGCFSQPGGKTLCFDSQMGTY